MGNLKTAEQLKQELSAPLPSDAVKPHPTKTYLSSIKAIYVTERLNDVFGIGKWQLKTDLVERGNNGTVVVKATLTVPEYNVYYESFGGNDNGGENSKNFDLGDAFKGATTDAITKIGSYLEIGIDVFKGKGNSPAKPKSTPAPATKPAEAKPSTIQPSKEFTKPEAKLDARKQKASDAYDKLDQAKVLKYLISEKKFSYPTVKEFIEKESIDTVSEVYNHVSAFKK